MLSTQAYQPGVLRDGKGAEGGSGIRDISGVHVIPTPSLHHRGPEGRGVDVAR